MDIVYCVASIYRPHWKVFGREEEWKAFYNYLRLCGEYVADTPHIPKTYGHIIVTELSFIRKINTFIALTK